MVIGKLAPVASLTVIVAVPLAMPFIVSVVPSTLNVAAAIPVALKDVLYGVVPPDTLAKSSSFTIGLISDPASMVSIGAPIATT